jgi:hypothetical protein
MPLFFIYCVFVVHDTGIDVIHYCCMDAVGWKRQEVELKWACRVSVWVYVGFEVKVSRGITQCPHRDSNLCPAHQRL